MMCWWYLLHTSLKFTFSSVTATGKTAYRGRCIPDRSRKQFSCTVVCEQWVAVTACWQWHLDCWMASVICVTQPSAPLPLITLFSRAALRYAEASVRMKLVASGERTDSIGHSRSAIISTLVFLSTVTAAWSGPRSLLPVQLLLFNSIIRDNRKRPEMFNPLVDELQKTVLGPLYNNVAIGTLALDVWCYIWYKCNDGWQRPVF